MKCPNCGKEIANDSSFCEYCGKEIKPRKNKKWHWAICGIVCVAVIILILLIIPRKSSEAQDDVSRELKEYVDLGLPSGTLWKDKNEEGYYDYFEAEDAFEGSLPTIEQFLELQKYCDWRWTRRGYEITGPNGNTIFLPAAGYGDCEYNFEVDEKGEVGSYWLQKEYEEYDNDDYYIEDYPFFDFDTRDVEMDEEEGCVHFSVRLVCNKLK